MFKLDPSTIPSVILTSSKITALLDSDDPPIIAAVIKVLPMNDDQNAILCIYLTRYDKEFEGLSPGTVFAICQFKTATTQVMIDCVLSKEYMPLKPVWYTDYCKQMIDKYCALLHREILLLVGQTLTTSDSAREI